MHTALYLAALAGVAYSAPQKMNLDAIALNYDPPELVKAPVNVETNIPPDVASDPIVPLQSVSAKKRDLDLQKRDGDCSPYEKGSGPVPTPDTAEAFQADPDFSAMANNAPTPDGYALVFSDKKASLSASNYMGLYTLGSYDTLTCASKCDQAEGCQAFNVYLERDPTLNANTKDCPNPPSTTNYRCTLWGAPVCPEEATNSGQYQASFHVVIAGSNAYNKAAPPPAINGYTGPQELGGAIDAPTSSGSYMGYQFFPFSQSQGYDPQTCADVCDAQTLYDSQHPAADGSYMSCVFFNSYVLSENGIPQGLYCSMYNQTWDRSYGTNYGQYRGSDRYTVSESYSYSKSSNSGQQPPKGSTSSSAKSVSSTSSTLPSSPVTVASSQVSSSTSSTSSQASSAASSTSAQTISTSAATCVPTPANNVVQNGGFECGLSPWVAADVMNTKHSISSPGDNSMFAYEFDQIDSIDPDSSMHPASVNQDLTIIIGQAYTLKFRTYFDKCTQSEGFVGVMLNHQAVYTVDACDFGAGGFKDNTVSFTPTVTPFNLRFEFVIGETNAVVKIDNVAAVPVSSLASTSVSSSKPSTATSAATTAPSASCGSPAIQNGGFETGNLAPWTVGNLVGQSTNSIVKPGSTLSGGGDYSFYGNLYLPSNPYAGKSGLTLKQQLSTCAGTTYSLSVDYKLQSGSGGQCTITIEYPGGSWSVNTYSAPYNQWARTAATFKASTNADVFDVVMYCTAPGYVWIDNVNITPRV